MLSVLIVDDERTTREFLVEYIPWSTLGFSDVQQAENGEQAYWIAQQMNPNLVLTDIMMPKMRGIELIEQLHEQQPDIKAVFLSAYSDKHYLKAAIRLGAIDYVEKPIDVDELIAVIKRVVQRIEQEQKFKEKSLLLERLVSSLCQGANGQDLEKHVIGAKLDIYSRYTAILLKSTSENAIEIVSNILQKQFSKPDSSIVCAPLLNIDDGVPVIIATDLSRKQLIEGLQNASKIWMDEGLSVFCAVGITVQGFLDIHKSWEAAVGVSWMDFYMNCLGLVTETATTVAPYRFSETLLVKLSNAFEQENSQSITELVQICISELQENRPADINYVRNIFFKILQVFENYIAKKNLLLEKFFVEDKETYLWQTVSTFRSLSQFAHYIDQLQTWMFLENPGNSYTDNVRRALAYIHDHIGDYNLGVGSIAAYINMTPSYLCQIFKKSTGITLNQYVIEQRILVAQRNLTETGDSLSKVAQGVGYYDAKYFTKVFKKVTGQTPSEYRRKHQWEK